MATEKQSNFLKCSFCLSKIFKLQYKPTDNLLNIICRKCQKTVLAIKHNPANTKEEDKNSKTDNTPMAVQEPLNKG